MTSLQEIITILKQILIEELGVDPQIIHQAQPETPLVGNGIGLDSMETLTVLTGIENHFSLEIPDEDFTVELFQNLTTLASYIQKRLQQ